MRRLALATTVTVALHAAIAFLASSPLFYLVNVATAQKVMGHSIGERQVFEDVRSYHEYASRAVAGEIPYRDFAVEYPIAAFPLFLIPRLFAPGLAAYQFAFAAEMIAFDAAIVAILARWADSRGRLRATLAWYSLGIAALGPLLIARFDLAPTFLAFAAVMASRAGWAGFAAGLGGLMKLFPAVAIVPIMRSDAGRRRFSGAIALGITLALGGLIWAAVGRSGMADSIGYHAGRGLEIESIYGGILILIARLRGSPMAATFNHASIELIAPGAALMAGLSTPIQAAAILLAAWRSRGMPPVEGPRWAAASVLGFAAFGKVLSPQYVLWILPLAAVIEGRIGANARRMVLAIAALTALVYPWAGGALIVFHPVAVGLLNLRNLLLVGLYTMLVLGRDQTTEARSPVGSA